MMPIRSTAAIALAAFSLGIAPDGALGAESQDHAQHQSQHSHDDHAGHQPPVATPPAKSVALKVPDALLTDQDGRQRRLVSEIMGDQVIVANFVYTSCTTICPVTSALFSQLQDKLGEQLDRQVRLISLSVDPARDTPARLKSYAATHGARPGWVWLTGAPAEVTAALKGFGTYTANYKDHPVVILIGDGRSGQWTRYFGFQDSERLANKVKEVLAARGPLPAVATGSRHEHH